MNVKVLSVTLDGPIACEVGYQREKGVDIFGAPLVNGVVTTNDVVFSSNDPYLMDVSVKAPMNYGARLFLKAKKRGTPILLARLPGAFSPMLAMQEVDEFTLDIPALDNTVFNSETSTGTSTITVKPYIPNVTFMLDMFAHTSTFSGGSNNLRVNTSSLDPVTGLPLFTQVYDEASGEIIGQYKYDIEAPAGENAYCFSLKVDQHSSHGSPASETHFVNGTLCIFTVNRLVVPLGVEGTMKVTPDIGNPLNHLYSKKHELKIVKCAATVTPSTYDCWERGMAANWNPKITQNFMVKAGKYEVTIDDTSFGKKYVVVEVAFDPSPLDFIIVSKNAPLTATVSPIEAQSFVTFESKNTAVATVSGSAPNLTVNAVGSGATQVVAKIGALEIGTVDVSTIVNGVLPVANATVAKGAKASIPLPADAFGLTYPEDVTPTITAGRDGTTWKPIVTDLRGNYSIQTRLLPGPPKMNEITGPAPGNTTAENAKAQVTSLSALGKIGEWYMIQAVINHENVHAARMLPAFNGVVFRETEKDIEQVNISSAGKNQAAAIVALQASEDFKIATKNAHISWRAIARELGDQDHAANGPCDIAERAVVDPMITRIKAAFPAVFPAVP